MPANLEERSKCSIDARPIIRGIARAEYRDQGKKHAPSAVLDDPQKLFDWYVDQPEAKKTYKFMMCDQSRPPRFMHKLRSRLYEELASIYYLQLVHEVSRGRSVVLSKESIQTLMLRLAYARLELNPDDEASLRIVNFEGSYSPDQLVATTSTGKLRVAAEHTLANAKTKPGNNSSEMQDNQPDYFNRKLGHLYQAFDEFPEAFGDVVGNGIVVPIGCDFVIPKGAEVPEYLRYHLQDRENDYIQRAVETPYDHDQFAVFVSRFFHYYSPSHSKSKTLAEQRPEIPRFFPNLNIAVSERRRNYSLSPSAQFLH